MTCAIDELRPVTALRLLEIWQEQRQCGGDGLERCMLCNAQVLAECCFFQGEAVFENQWEVMRQLTSREMEALLTQLGNGRELPEQREQENPAFDLERFRKLGED